MVARRAESDIDLAQPAASETWLSTATHKVRDVFRGAPMLSLLFLAIALSCALFAPWIAPYSPVTTNPANILEAPSLFSDHILGTDNQGRDILSRIIYGAQTSVKIGVLSVLLAAVVGTSIGLLSGVFRGWTDRILMRSTDMFLALPYLMVALTVVSLLGASIGNVILVIGLLRWIGFARVLRGEVLKLVEMDFVRLATVSGSSRYRIMLRHVFPNIIKHLVGAGDPGAWPGGDCRSLAEFFGPGCAPGPCHLGARCSEIPSNTSTSLGGSRSFRGLRSPCW